MSSTCTLPLVPSEAVIVTLSSAVITILLAPVPALVASILNDLADVEFCVVWNVRLPSPILSKVCEVDALRVMSGSPK